MGTNFYRIPKASEMKERKEKLIEKIMDMDLSPFNIERNFSTIDKDGSTFGEKISPWDEFLESSTIHLGKRSMGWKFCWNFHKNKYYSNKEDLMNFIRSGRVVDEYGEEQDVEEFIEMSLNWCQPNGLVVNSEYEKTSGSNVFIGPNYWDLEIDGLRVSSSTDFC